MFRFRERHHLLGPSMTQSMECVCPITGKLSQVRRLAYSPAPWQLVQCEQTGFVFLRNPPSYDALAGEFAWQTTFIEERQKRRHREPVISRASECFKRWRTSTFRHRDKLLSLTMRCMGKKDSLTILDIGSARGGRMAKFCRNLSDQGIRATPMGIEISPELAAESNTVFMRYGGKVVSAAALDGVTEFTSKCFDVVVMSCYLEHEPQPLEVLRRTQSIVKDDGVVLIKVPNYNSINRFWRGRRWCGFRFPDHVNYFTPKTLRILAANAGYSMQPQRWLDRPATSDNMYAVLSTRPGGYAEMVRAA